MNKITKDTLYSMDLHEKIQMNDLVIIRVPGGWWYQNEATSIMVPYDAEFKYVGKKYTLGKKQIISIVSAYYCNHYGLNKEFYKFNSRKVKDVEGRWMIAKFLNDLLEMNQTEIAKELHYTERSTLSNALFKITKKIESNATVRKNYLFMLEQINQL